MALTKEDIREEVRVAQAPMERTLNNLATSMEKLADHMIESKAIERSNEQKFIRVHERIDDNTHRMNEQTHSLVTLTTDVIPQLEREVTKNTLSSGVFWRFIFILATPLCGGIGTVLYLFQDSQKEQVKMMIEAVKLLGGAG